MEFRMSTAILYEMWAVFYTSGFYRDVHDVDYWKNHAMDESEIQGADDKLGQTS